MGLYIRLRKVVLSIFICVFIISVAEADPSISIDNGLRIVSGDDNNSFLLGGYLLVDTIPVDSHTSRLPRFDLFNAWLFMQGKVNKRFTYKIQFSLDDYSSRKLRDAFVGFEVAPGHIVQIGHFDVPTFAEHLSALSFTPLAGRSMVDSLAPGR
ncbi:MAG: hypothetical protein OEY11_15410, partial [Gammaproteobacteria bacterium]|nr:hypothetical protein [Gammaproteobacteria bacterium]